MWSGALNNFGNAEIALNCFYVHDARMTPSNVLALEVLEDHLCHLAKVAGWGLQLKGRQIDGYTN